MATLQGKAVKNTYRQVLQIGANNVGVSGTLQPVQDGAGVNTALSLSTLAATVNGDLTVTGDLIITGGGLQIKELIDDTVANLIKNGTGITWTYNDAGGTLTGNFTGTTSVVPEGSNLYYTQGRFDSAFAAKSTTNLAEGTNLYFTEARGNANFATNLAASDTNDLAEGSTNLYFTNARARTALSVTAGTGIAYNNTTGVFNLAAIPNASLANSSITINGQAVSLGGTVTLTTTNIGEGTNLYWTEARGNSNFTTNLAASSTTNLAEGTNLYYTQARFDTAFSNKTTTNLAEGTNLYYTQARFNSALAAKTTTDLAEGTNLYYTDARARLALSSSATGLTYANNSGVFSLTAGYAIPTTVKLGQYDTAYNRSIVSAAVTGTTTKTLSLTQQDANVVSATWTDLGITTINGTANQIATTTVGNTTTVAFTNDVTMPNNLIVSGNLTINGTATYVNTQSISAKDPLFEVANDNNTTDAVDIGYYGRYYDTPQTRVEFTGLFRDASDAGKFKFFTGLVDEPTNVVNTTGTGYTVGTLVANFEGNLAGTANAANALSTARTIAASGDATWSVSFDGSANVTSALTLANTGVTATTYGTSTAVPTIAVDSKGRITSASNTNITFPVTTVNGQAGTVVLTTSDIAEGSNQYFTSARAQAAISGTAPISVASGVVSISQSGGSSNGFLSSTDWNTFNNKQAAITGAATTITSADLTASRALISNASGKVATSATTDTELGYVSGVTSAIQTQINTKAADNLVVHLAGAETITGAKTFTSTIVAPQVKAGTSAGLSINANSGTQVADFGAGGSANITFFGGLSGTSASFSSSVTATTGTTGAAIKLTGVTNYGFIEDANAVRRIWFENTGDYRTILDLPASGTAFQFRNSSGSILTTITSGGNVGIGTTPELKLTVNGAMNLRNSTRAGAFEIDSSGNLWMGSATTAGNIYFETGHSTTGLPSTGTIRMTITGGGEVQIGPASNQVRISSQGTFASSTLNAHIINADGTGAYSSGDLLLQPRSSSGGGANNIVFGTSNNTNTVTERMRITSGGYLKASNDGTYYGSTSNYYEFISNAQDNTMFVWNKSASPNGIFINYTNAPNNTGNNFLNFYDGNVGTQRFAVRSNGGIANYQSNNVPLSDQRMKKEITLLESYWDKFKSIEMVKFKYIDQTHDDFNIGVISQQIESIMPEFVDVWDDKNIPEDGKPLMGVYMEDLHNMTMKVLQEAMARIEEQQAQIEELKAMIAAK
jgi:hypothetical protein